MRTNDYDPKVSDLVDGVPTAKNQEGETLEEYIERERAERNVD